MNKQDWKNNYQTYLYKTIGVGVTMVIFFIAFVALLSFKGGVSLGLGLTFCCLWIIFAIWLSVRTYLLLDTIYYFKRRNFVNQIIVHKFRELDNIIDWLIEMPYFIKYKDVKDYEKRS